MGGKKAKSKGEPSASNGRFGLSTGPGRAIALGLAIGVLFFGGWYGVWRGVGEHVLQSKEYWLTLEQVEMTPQPAWIQGDLRKTVFSDASLDGPLSIMDPLLVDRIAEAFSLHPWVARVRQVRKYPGAIVVDLEYRRPVCAVEVFVDGNVQLLPVDSGAVVLPKDDFSAAALSQYPRLVGENALPIGPEGTCWGDPRVLGAAQIAAAFGDEWQRLSLDQIVATRAADPGASEACDYELYTRRRTRVIWGRGPEHPLADEFPPAEKIARLGQYASEHGSLDDLEQIDVRSLASYRIIPRRSDPGAGR